MRLIRLLYTSQAAQQMSAQRIEQIVKVARYKNSEALITGILLYGNGQFMQVLEGDERRVVELFNRVARDGRHCEVDVLVMRPTSKRLFGEWSMGLLNLEHVGLDGDLPLRDVLFNANKERRDAGYDVLDVLRKFIKSVQSHRVARMAFDR
jgi:hypothetical protein